MFAVVVWIFMVCWAPYHIYFIYSYHNPEITRISYISHVYLAFYWLAMATTCVNPIIYYWMNKRFRAYFNMIFFFLPRYVSRAASTRWSLEENYRERRESSLSRITRTRSCPATSRRTNSARSSAMSRGGFPVRAISVVQSDSFDLSDCQGRGRGPIQRSLTYNSSLRRNNKLSIRSEQSQVISLGSDISENVF